MFISKKIIQELVNKNGSKLGGDNVKLSIDNSKSASNSTMDPMFDPEDGDQLKNSSIQSTRQQGYRGWYSLVPMPSVKTPVPNTINVSDNVSYMEDKKEKPCKHCKGEGCKICTKNKIKEASKSKMEEYVEDIVTKKISKDVLDKVKKGGDIRKNGIPEIDIIAEENPVLVRKTKNLIDAIKSNLATGEEKGIILNFLITNIDTIDIPVEYKNEMLKKLK
jgi:hypothetical protein